MASYSEAIEKLPLIFKVLILLALLFTLLFVLTWTNTMRCSTIPGWCSIYYSIKGRPKVLIVYGDSGLGKPELLAKILARPHGLGIRPRLMHIDSISLGNLKEYDLVIVERARIMSSAKIKMFFDYANSGGKLVWIADSGVEAPSSEEYLYEDEISFDKNAEHKLVSPWARKYKDQAILFNEFLSVEYIANFSELRKVSKNEMYIGNLKPINRTNPFVFGISGSLPFYLAHDADFAIVKPIETGTSTIVLTLDFGSSFHAKDKKIPREIPIIVANSKANLMGFKISENIAYYAIPPEYFALDSLPEEHRYYSFADRMLEAMLYG